LEWILTKLNSLAYWFLDHLKAKKMLLLDILFDLFTRTTLIQKATTLPPTPSSSNSTEDLDNVPEEKELAQKDLKYALLKRDVVCLFGWNKSDCKGSLILLLKRTFQWLIMNTPFYNELVQFRNTKCRMVC
jgi:hypothetical protein